MADTLKYQETILSRHSGDLYRIASIIVDNTFSDDAIVNPVNNAYDINNKKDILNMGIFEVAERKNKEYQSSLSCEVSNYKLLQKWVGQENVSFNIVLFLCKNEKERFLLQEAGFTLVCN